MPLTESSSLNKTEIRTVYLHQTFVTYSGHINLYLIYWSVN